MSNAKKANLKNLEGKSRYLTTRQLKPTKAGFVGYETIWESFQKEVKYTTPKRP